MDKRIIKEIDVDFYNRHLTVINAKRQDKLSRFVLINCYNQGEVFKLDSSIISAYVRYKKADGIGVFNSCEITDDGQIQLELTEQMLATAGSCHADIVIVDNSKYSSQSDIGQSLESRDGYILSSMTFCINVIDSALENSVIESSYEYNALNKLLSKATTDYSAIISECRLSAENAESMASDSLESATMSKSYAVGGTSSRENEDTDNAKYYYDQIKAIVPVFEIATIAEVREYLNF